MTDRCEIAIVGSGFAGSLLARVLAVLGYDVALLERGTHPRFAIGESSTPLANLSLERIGTRYGLRDCYNLATHGRWTRHFPDLRRGLKRGFTFYRHHPNESFADRGLDSERLLVAASPHESLSDTHWLRADVDHHFVKQAIGAGVDYRDRTEITVAEFNSDVVVLKGDRGGSTFELDAGFVIDASGPGGFLARQLSIPSALDRTHTRSALVFSHFAGVRPMSDLAPGMPEGPYPDQWAAVHHLIDEGWMYSLRFDDGVTSAGFLVTPRGMDSLQAQRAEGAGGVWHTLLDRYPTLRDAFGEATPVMPIGLHPAIQHRLSRATGERWLLMPHAFAFIDPLFSTGIAWSLRAVERIGHAFEAAASGERIPAAEFLERYEATLNAEADQIDLVVAGAYEAMAHFDLFAAQAMLYFATVSFAEVSQRLAPGDANAWGGFMGAGDPAIESVAAEAHARLIRVTRGAGDSGTVSDRRAFSEWIASSIAPRNIAGLADPERHNLYPVDFDAVIDGHQRLGMTRDQVVAALPALRGMSPEPKFDEREPASGSTLLSPTRRSHPLHENGLLA